MDLPQGRQGVEMVICNKHEKDEMNNQYYVFIFKDMKESPGLTIRNGEIIGYEKSKKGV